MFILFKTLNSFFKLLNSETAPGQIAIGFAFGMLVGLTPFSGLHNLVILMIVVLFRVNLSMFFMSTAIFAILGFFLDPLFDKFGYALLVNFKQARPLWILISSGAIWPFFRFNNTIMMGSLAAGLVLFIPAFLFAIRSIRLYRSRWREQIKKSKFMKALKATPIYGLYEKYEGLRQRLSVFE